MRYDAFVSYSHAADGRLAPRLQSALERFATPWWKRRSLRIFRDESSLSASPHLWSSIAEALDDAAWLILLLSPDAAQSEWVNREIDHWRSSGRSGRILPVVTGGTFDWDADVVGTAVPSALVGAFDEEPRVVDLRFAITDAQLDSRNPRFASAVADIASAVRGVPKDELESDDVREHRRTIRTAWAAGVGLALLAVGLAAVSVFALDKRTEARAEALLAHAAGQLDTDPELSMLLALEAIELTGSPSEAATANLLDGLVAHRTTAIVERGARSIALPTHHVSPDGRFIAVWGSDDGTVRMHDSATGELLWSVEDVGEGNLSGGAFAAREELLYVIDSGWRIEGGASIGTLIAFDIASGRAVDRVDLGSCPVELHPGPVDGRLLFVRGAETPTGSCDGTDAVLAFLDPPSGEIEDIASFQYSLSAGGRPTASRDGGTVAVADARAGLRVIDVATGEEKSPFGTRRSIATLDGTASTVLVSGSLVEVRDVNSGDPLLAFPVTDPIDAVFFGGSRFVAISSADGVVHVFDANGRELARLTGHRSIVSSIWGSVDGSTVISEAADGIRVWNLDSLTGADTASLDLPGSALDTGEPGMAGLAGGHLLVPYHVPGVWDHRYEILGDDGRSLRSSPTVGAFALSPDGSVVVEQRWTANALLPAGGFGGRQESIVVSEAVSGEALVELEACGYTITNTSDYEVEPVDGCEAWVAVTDFAFSADGKRVAAVGSRWHAAVWDVQTGKRLWMSDRIDAPFYWSHEVGISPDGRHVFVLDLVAGGYRSWDVETGEATGPIGSIVGAAEIVVHPIDPVAFIAERSGKVVVVDTANWTVLDELAIPGAGLTDMTLSPDGELVSIVSDAGDLATWEWRTGRSVGAFDLDARLFHLAHVGRDLLVIDAEGQATRIPSEPQEVIDLAVQRLTRGLRPNECVAFDIDPCPDLEDVRSR